MLPAGQVYSWVQCTSQGHTAGADCRPGRAWQGLQWQGIFHGHVAAGVPDCYDGDIKALPQETLLACPRWPYGCSNHWHHCGGGGEVQLPGCVIKDATGVCAELTFVPGATCACTLGEAHMHVCGGGF